MPRARNEQRKPALSRFDPEQQFRLRRTREPSREPMRDQRTLHGAQQSVGLERRCAQRRGIESITTAIRKREASARKVDAAHEEASLFDIELRAKVADLNDVFALAGQVTNAALEDCEQSMACDRLPFVGETTVVVEDESQRLERRRPVLGHAAGSGSASALPSAWTRNTPSKS